MASSQDQTVNRSEDVLTKKGGKIIDRRTFIEDPRKDISVRPPLKTIFPLLLHCGKCDIYSLGTCFLLQDELRNVFGEGRDYHYFVTAGHNLVCKTCRRDGEKRMPYREVKIVWEWTPGKGEPDSYVCDTITAKNNHGWIRVSNEFRTKTIGTDEAFLHDFGVIAARKSDCSGVCKDSLRNLSKLCLQALSGQPEEAEEAYICGYPGLVDESVFSKAKPRNYDDLDDSKEDPGKKKVYGLMMWMPPTEWKAASSPSEQESPRERSDRERSTTAAYRMPQHHCNHDSDKVNSSQAKDKLYRYYIDTSPGQSGSPVCIEREDGNGDKSYYCVGIHIGTWTFSPKELSCNVCFNVNEAIQRMKDEKWADVPKGTPVVSAITKTNDIQINEDLLKGDSLFGEVSRAAVVSKRSDAGNQDALGAKGHASGAGQKGVSSGGAATSQDFDRPPADRSKNPWLTSEYTSTYPILVRRMTDSIRTMCYSLQILSEDDNVAISEETGSRKRNRMLLSAISTTARMFPEFREILRADSIKTYADCMDDLDSVGPDPEDPKCQKVRADVLKRLQ